MSSVEREKCTKKGVETSGSQVTLTRVSAQSDPARPFYLKKSKKKLLLLMQKYKELKSQGQLESYLVKKRKKRSSTGRKYIPSTADLNRTS